MRQEKQDEIKKKETRAKGVPEKGFLDLEGLFFFEKNKN